MARVRDGHKNIGTNPNHTTRTLQAGDQWVHETSSDRDIPGFSLRLEVSGPGPLLYRQGGVDVEAQAGDPELPIDPRRADFLMDKGHFVALLVKEDGTYTTIYRTLHPTRNPQL